MDEVLNSVHAEGGGDRCFPTKFRCMFLFMLHAVLLPPPTFTPIRCDPPLPSGAAAVFDLSLRLGLSFQLLLPRVSPATTLPLLVVDRTPPPHAVDLFRRVSGALREILFRDHAVQNFKKKGGRALVGCFIRGVLFVEWMQPTRGFLFDWFSKIPKSNQGRTIEHPGECRLFERWSESRGHGERQRRIDCRRTFLMVKLRHHREMPRGFYEEKGRRVREKRLISKLEWTVFVELLFASPPPPLPHFCVSHKFRLRFEFPHLSSVRLRIGRVCQEK